MWLDPEFQISHNKEYPLTRPPPRHKTQEATLCPP